jgi:DMSO/TMAO reductase YedYZ heme-binding membrane subunit
VYFTAIGAALHYFWKVKLDTTSPIYYALVLGALLAARMWQAAAKRQAASATAVTRVARQS